MVKNPYANARDDPSWEDPWRKNANSLQYPCLGNPMERGVWWATVHGAAKSQAGLSN